MEKEITLKNRFEKGQEIKYKSKTEIYNKARDDEKKKDIGTQSAVWEIEITQRILEIEGDMNAHILYHSTPVSVPIEAQMMGVLNKKQVIYVFMSPIGKIIEASGIGFQGIVNFPGKPIKQGDTWTEVTEVELPGFPQPLKHSRTFTLDGFEKIKEYECAKVIIASEGTELDIPAPDGRGNVKYTVKTKGEIYFAYVEGFLVKSAIATFFSSRYGSIVMEGNNHFQQELLEVKAKVSA